MASSNCPNSGRRWSINASSASSACARVTGQPKVCRVPGWLSNCVLTSVMTCCVVVSGSNRVGGGTFCGPALPKDSRLSASKFHWPPTGSFPSIRMPYFLRSSRYQYSSLSCLRPSAWAANSRTVLKKWVSSRRSSGKWCSAATARSACSTRQSPGAVRTNDAGRSCVMAWSSCRASVLRFSASSSWV